MSHAAMVRRLLARHGTSATLETIVRTSDPATSTATETKTSTSVRCSPPYPARTQAEGVGGVSRTSLETWVAGEQVADLAIRPNDRLIVAGKLHLICEVDPLEVNGQLVALRLVVQGAP